MWFWVSVISGLASAFDKVLNRIALKDKDNVLAYSFLYITLMALISLIFSLPIPTHLSVTTIGLIFLQTAFWSIGTLTAFMSQAKTDVSLSMILSRSRMLWILPFGYFILGERLSSVSFIGIFIIFLGFLVLFYKQTFHTHRGVQLMLLSSLFVTVGTVINAILIKSAGLNALQVTFFTVFGQSLVFLVILYMRSNPISKIKNVIQRSWLLIILSAVIEVVAFAGNIYALKIGPPSAVTAIYLSMTIITIWIGVIFLKERTHVIRKLVSSTLVTIGIIILKIFT